MEHDAVQQAYNEGLRAFQTNKISNRNPYTEDTPEHAAWKTAVDKMDEQEQRRRIQDAWGGPV